MIEIGTFALRAQFIALFFIPMTVCANMMFQSVGFNGRATFLSALRSGLCFIPIVMVLTSVFGLVGVQISQTVADVATWIVTVPFIMPFLRKLRDPESLS